MLYFVLLLVFIKTYCTLMLTIQDKIQRDELFIDSGPYGLFRGSPSFYEGEDTDTQDQIRIWSEREKTNNMVGEKR